MSLKIDDDLNRFKNIIRNKTKHNLGKFVSSENLLGQQGKKTVSIPINSIDLPRFTYSSGAGGAGTGDGNIGDPMSGQGQKGDGSGKAGNESGEHQYVAEFTPDELAQMLGEELQLPDVDPKGKGKVGSFKSKYNSIHRVGPEGLRHFKRSYKEALKRSISTGTYNPADPVVIPIKEDKRYKASQVIPQPEVNAVVIYILDCSGSMTTETRQIAKSEVFWIDAWLQHQYKSLESRFIVHDTEAQEVDREQFFTISESGGTNISSGYKYAAHLLETEYPFSENNSYLLQYSDGDNYDIADDNLCVELLKNKILPNCNLFCYEQIATPGGSGEFFNVLGTHVSGYENLFTHKIADKTGILESLKFFLGKGK